MAKIILRTGPYKYKDHMLKDQEESDPKIKLSYPENYRTEKEIRDLISFDIMWYSEGGIDIISNSTVTLNEIRLAVKMEIVKPEEVKIMWYMEDIPEFGMSKELKILPGGYLDPLTAVVFSTLDDQCLALMNEE